MANEKRLMDKFKSELMSKFIDLCWGNDYNKLTLLRIGETVDRIYEKYSLLPTVDAVEVVRCKDCKRWSYIPELDKEPHCTLFCGLRSKAYPTKPDDFCSYGERRTEDG